MSLGYLRTLLITDPLIVLLTVLCGSASLVASIFDSTGRTQHQIARRWARLLLGVSRIRVTVEGLERIHPGEPYVFVTNHRSFMDTPVALAYLPVDFRFMAKKALFKIPFLGTHLKRAGHLPVARGDAKASVRSLTDAARLIRERRISVLIFPEGGRTRGTMRDFKEGAAYIAIKAGVPIAPLGIVGTRAALPMGSGHIRSAHVRLCVGQPIDTADLSTRDRNRLSRTVQQQVAELIGEAPGQRVSA